ncbi:MAG: V-type ATP synthase subunit D [Promethearchaeota archaeon]|nr:MAG: V-type ATP synthase subunit D [Candidatus Lokiarchaeota archaeon]
MSFREIKPTKSNLLKLKERLEFTEKGESFLDYKRTELISEIRSVWTNYKNQHKRFLKRARKILLLLNDTYKEQGKRSLETISKMGQIQFDPKVDLKYSTKLGIAIPTLNFKLRKKENLPPYGFDNTSKHLDELMNLLKDFIEDLLLVAETEDVLIKYAFNFQKIDRRMKGLKNIIKPQIESDIKKIETILEENERERFTRLKKTKDKLK